MQRLATFWLIFLTLTGLCAGTAQADEVTDWNAIMFRAALTATPPTTPLVTTRVAAIVQAAVFDAVNGIERRYTPIHVTGDAPRGASQRAAAVEAAYASLVLLYPPRSLRLMLNVPSRLRVSLAGLPPSIASPLNGELAGAIKWLPRFGPGAARMASHRRRRQILERSR